MPFTIPQRKLTWLITGSSSGFGLSLVRTVQAAGHKVIAASRNPSQFPDLVEEVESKGGKWVQLDPNSRDSSKVIEELESSGHEIDVLINNAGYCAFGPLETATEDEIRDQLEAMFFGPLRLTRAVIPHMRKRQFGTIANFSSGAALDGNPTMGAYAGAKAGLDAASKVLAKEVAPFNIRVLTVVLGTFNTNMASSSKIGANPVPEEYEGTMVATMLKYIKAGLVKPNGDKDKAMKAVYEVIVGEGAGAGKEEEKFLPLGTDMTPRVKGLADSLNHTLEVFGEVTNGVALEN